MTFGVSRRPALNFLFAYHLTMRAFDSVYLAVLVHQGSCERKSGFFA
jgi:hypothetical protein